MNKLEKILIVAIGLCLFLINNPLVAQVSQGGTPPSFSEQGTTPSSSGVSQPVAVRIPLIDVPVTFDFAKLRAEDAEAKEQGLPPRLGVTIPLNGLDLLKKGEWTTLGNGQRVCRLAIRAAGAKALNLYYEQFYIPEGGQLFIYDKKKTHILGAFTNENNIGRKFFATEYTAGDEVILEYVAPAETEGEPVKAKITDPASPLAIIPSTKSSANSAVIIISEVGYAYGDNVLVVKNNNDIQYGLLGLNESGSCMVNINCPEGDDWQREKNAVSRLIIYKGGGQYYCSGTLIHNTSRDFTPYLITAFHCFENATAEEIQQTVFYFNYEQPECGNSVKEPEHKTVVGGSILVNIPIENNSDGALVLLNERIPEDWGQYWSGWDRRNVPMKQGVGIHHPTGDVMKISTVPPDVTVSGQWPAAPYGAPGAHWELVFEPTVSGYGVVEGGSSGSGLFNQDKRLVGTLTGGSAKCTDPTKPNLYGKLWYHWDQSKEPSQHMKPFLDPIDSGVEFMDGEFLSGATSVNFNVVSNTAFAGEEVYYTNLCYGEIDAWNWEFPGGTPSTSTKRNPVVIYSAPGKYSAKLTVSYREEGIVKQLSRERTDIVTITQKTVPCDAETIEIGTGTQVSSFPLGSTDVQAYSASVYNRTSLNRSGVIEKLSWNASAASTTERKLRIYMKESNDSTFTAASWDNEIAGATLVYESADDYTPSVGWTDIPLTTAFEYTGIRHLKILVHSVSASAPYESSALYYSAKMKAHMQWNASDMNPVTGNGMVTNNLPNIRIGFAEGDCGRAPVANFEMLGSPFYTEAFDAYEFPEGWTITKSEASLQQWQLGNILTNPFTKYDPNNISSAAFAPDEKGFPVDSWLISKAITLPAGMANIQFFIGFSAKKAATLPLTFYISEDGKANWQEIWKTPSGFMDWNWYRVTRNISQYAGKEVYLAWRVSGTDGDYITLDQIQLFEDKNQLEIFEGESVHFIDKSVGPPVYWKWNLPGGTPATSTATTVQSVYLDEGEYNAKLSVQNNIGKDSLQIDRGITVRARTPVARIASVGGYTRALNHQRFIPIGATITYADTSLFIPKNWKWDFEGGTPVTANTKKVDVQYNTEGEYATRLTVGNVKGSDDTLVSGYVKVGGTDRIWNMPKNDNGESLFLMGETGDGYLTGINRTKADKFAELFAAPQESVSISKIDIRFRIEGTKVADEKVTVSIYSAAPGAITQPHKQLVSTVLPVAEINTEGYTSIELPNAVVTAGKYFVVVEGFEKLKTPLAIASSDMGFYSYNSAYVYHLETWYTMPTYAGSGIGVSLNIVPTVTYLHLAVTSPDRYTVAFDDTLHRTVTAESNTTWSITAAQPWIVTNKSSVDGNGSFTFKCTPNVESVDRHGVILLNGGEGVVRRIYVVQTTGDSIVGLQAEIMEDFNSVQLKWGNSLTDENLPDLMQSSGVVLPNIVKVSRVDSIDCPIIEKADVPQNTIPETMAAEKSLKWNKGGYANYMSYSGAKHYQIATLFYPEDLAQYHGGKLTDVEFFPLSLATFRILVYQNEVLVADSLLKNVTPAVSNRVDISSKGVVIDATKSLRITLDIVASAFARAITLDAGPAVVGKGNLLNNNLNNEWAPLTDFSGWETSGNWMLSGYVKMQNTPGYYYRLYRNGEKLVETEGTNYVDPRVTLPGEYCYEVTKVANDTENESPKSEKACVTIKPTMYARITQGVRLDYGYAMPTPEELSALNGLWDRGAIGVKILKEPTIKMREDIQPTSPAGVYPNAIVISDLEVENGHLYNIRYVHGPFYHSPRPVTVAANENTKKTYGDSDPESIPFTVANLVEGEKLVGSLSRKPGENVGTYLVENGSLNNTNNPNYLVELAPGMSFTIAKRPVTVIPDETSKVYGDADPAVLSYTVKNGLSHESLEGILMRESGEKAGEYAIVQGQLDNARNPNYDITFRTGRKFMIHPREITVTPDPVFKTYGTSDPEITYTIAGLPGNVPLQGRLSRVQGENVGQYAITKGDLSLGSNYRVTVYPGIFVIRPADLFVQADNLNIGLGSLLPKPTYTMSGHKAEDESGLRSILDNSIYIDAPWKPSAGVYDILFGSEFSHVNYNATFAPGKITVSGMPVTAFIPGSADSKNATFMPEGTIYLKVFSRNGMVVYEGSQPWDGNNERGKVEAGVYFYTAKMADGSVIKGSIEVYKL